MASDTLVSAFLCSQIFYQLDEDQKQHLELTRELAERVSSVWWAEVEKIRRRGGAIFKVPEPLIPPAGARVMSLTDGLSKMSKSAPFDQSRINLLDPKDVIANKIKRCKTDSFPGHRTYCYEFFKKYLQKKLLLREVAEECQDMNWGTFKNVLTDALVDHLHPTQVQYKEIMSDPANLDTVLAEGTSIASFRADVILNNVFQAMGFLHR